MNFNCEKEDKNEEHAFFIVLQHFLSGMEALLFLFESWGCTFIIGVALFEVGVVATTPKV